MILLAGALLGFLSVVFGAFASHGLQGVLPEDTMRSVSVAIQYNQVHALAITAIGLVLLRGGAPPAGKLLPRVAYLFIAGTVFFSLTIYVSALTGMAIVTRLTPVGGILLMAGWLYLAWIGLRAFRDRHERGGTG